MKKITKISIIIIIVLLFLLLLLSVSFSLVNINNKNILNNITVNNIDISNMSKEEATTKLLELIDNKTKNSILISNNDDYQLKIDFKDLDVNYDINKAINEAFLIGRNDNIFISNLEIIKTCFLNTNINIDITYNKDMLHSIVENLSSNLPNKFVQSGYYIENDNLILTAGKYGEIIDEDNLNYKISTLINDLSTHENIIQIKTQNIDPNKLDINNIYQEIYKEAKNAYYEKEPLKIFPEVIGISFDKEYAENIVQSNLDEYIIPLQYTYPEIKIENLDLDFFKDTLAIFTTKYNITNEARSTNLELAAEKINGTILSPNEEFSYNRIVGARTIDKGYKEAKVYSNGQVVDGIGGGICQISSTLYDTAIIANLDITERHNHQFITSYLPAGKDATVVYGAKDLKFKNTRSYPVKIELKVENGIVTCKILGLKEENEYDITIETDVLSIVEPEIKYETDTSLEIGKEKVKQYGSNGSTVNTYKIKKQDGKIISKELLSQDTYKALEKIILKGE